MRSARSPDTPEGDGLVAARVGRPCPACGCPTSRAAGSKEDRALRRCASCSSLFVGWIPHAGATDYYDTYYREGNLAVPALVHQRLAELVDNLAPYRRLNRWLDVGCGAGALMQAAAQAGWASEGTEIAPRSVEHASGLGLTVHRGDVAELTLDEGAYDVVTLIEVLEHVADPRSLLTRVARLLRPGGVLHLTTPNGCGLSARLLGLRWSVVSPPEHLQLFSLPGLRAAIRAAGLVEAGVHRHAVNPHELIASLRPWRRSPAATGGERVEASYRLNEALESGRGGVWLKSGANRVLDTTGLGDTIKYRAARPSP